MAALVRQHHCGLYGVADHGFMVFHHHCMFCTMVLYHYPAGCEHPLVKVREHVWLQIREHLVVMPCDVYPEISSCGVTENTS